MNVYVVIIAQITTHLFGKRLIFLLFQSSTVLGSPFFTVAYYSYFAESKPKPCDSFPCMNNGTCFNKGDSFYCKCIGNFEGKTCKGLLK